MGEAQMLADCDPRCPSPMWEIFVWAWVLGCKYLDHFHHFYYVCVVQDFFLNVSYLQESLKIWGIDIPPPTPTPLWLWPCYAMKKSHIYNIITVWLIMQVWFLKAKKKKNTFVFSHTQMWFVKVLGQKNVVDWIKLINYSLK